MLKNALKIRKEVGHRIKMARLQAKLTQSQLGKRLDRTAASIAYIEAGERSISTDVLVHISRATRKPITYFLGSGEFQLGSSSHLKYLAEQLEHLTEMLDRSEGTYRFLMEQSPDLVFLMRADTFRLVDFSQRCLKYYGFSSEDFLGMSFLDLEQRESTKKRLRSYSKRVPKGKLFELSGSHQRMNGSRFQYHARLTKISQDQILANVRSLEKLKISEI